MWQSLKCKISYLKLAPSCRRPLAYHPKFICSSEYPSHLHDHPQEAIIQNLAGAKWPQHFYNCMWPALTKKYEIVKKKKDKTGWEIIMITNQIHFGVSVN